MTLKWLERIAREGEGTGGGGGTGGGDAGAGGGQGGSQGGSQAGGGPWYGAHEFDADTVAYIEERKFPDLKSALKSGRESHRLASSRNVIEKPDPQNLKDWGGHQLLGWDPDSGKYRLKAPDGGKAPYSAELWAEMQKVAHENRVPLPVLQSLQDAAMGFMEKQVLALETKGEGDLSRTMEALQKHWGADFEPKRQLAARAAQTLGLDTGDMGELDTLMGSATFVRMMAKIGESLGEASLAIPQTNGGGALPTTVAGLRAELNALQARDDFRKAFKDPRDPQYEDFSRQRQRIIDRIAKLEGRAA